jgi:hypothetical protein
LTVLNELEKRRPDFAGDSVPVKFADGQEWAVPKPWLTIKPIWGENHVAVATNRVRTYKDPEINAVIALISELNEPTEIVSGLATLAGCLLRLNYDLTEEDLDTLLAFDPDDAESMAWFAGVIETATGIRGRRSGKELANA